MIKTEYICDKCGKSQGKENTLWSVNVYIYFSAGVVANQGYSTTSRHKDWCRACVESYGLLPTVETKKEEVKQNVTIEDIIREIVRNEIPT